MTLTKTKPPSLCYRAFEFRANESSDGRTLEGLAAVFGQQTEIDSWEGTFFESIKRGAFAKTISERTPVLQFDHGRDMRTGTVPIGAIDVLEERQKGLFVRASLFDNPVVEPIRQAIAGGAIDGMSFRFRVVRERWTDAAGKEVPASELSSLLWNPGSRGPLSRELLEVQMPELGPVVFPAYTGTTVGVRSLLARLDENERVALIRELIESERLSIDLNDPSGDEEPPPDEEQDPDAGDDATSGEGTDAGQQATSGATPDQRAAKYRADELRRRTA